MARLGLSIYPNNSDYEQNKVYLDLANKYGFKRIYTCLLSADGDQSKIKAKYGSICQYAKSLGMEVIVDVAPSVFKLLEITYDDLSFFNELGATGIRLDVEIDGNKAAMMTYNPYGLKIEFNASIYDNYIDNVFSYKVNKEKIMCCHNFYPQKYTGLSLELFKKCNEKLKVLGVPIAAFINSNNPINLSPWGTDHGLCTLEEHRYLPVEVAAKHLLALGIDDVIVGNCYLTEEEMQKLAELSMSKLTIRIEELTALSDVERKIIYEFPHFVRPDMSDYMARSVQCRFEYKDSMIPPNNANKGILHRGDVVIINENNSHYKGELQVILKDIPNDGDKNLVGKIMENERFMIEFLKPFSKFKIIK